MTKMDEAVAAFSRHLEDTLVGHELSASAKEEFPKSASYHKGKYSRSEPPFPKMMRDLLRDAVRITRDFDLSGTLCGACSDRPCSPKIPSSTFALRSYE